MILSKGFPIIYILNVRKYHLDCRKCCKVNFNLVNCTVLVDGAHSLTLFPQVQVVLGYNIMVIKSILLRWEQVYKAYVFSNINLIDVNLNLQFYHNHIGRLRLYGIWNNLCNESTNHPHFLHKEAVLCPASAVAIPYFLYHYSTPLLKCGVVSQWMRPRFNKIFHFLFGNTLASD